MVFRFMSWLKETCASGEAGAKKREKECEKESGKGRGGGLPLIRPTNPSD